MTEKEAAAMPCTPDAFHIQPWVLPRTFGHRELEEAAARIVQYSQLLGFWVGVTEKEIIEMMRRDCEAAEIAQEVRDLNDAERQEFAKFTRSWRIKSVLTLGLYAYFIKKPELKLLPMPSVPMTGIFFQGPEFVATGIRELVEQGLIRYVEPSDKDDDLVFFPTPALVARILEVQSAQTVEAEAENN